MSLSWLWRLPRPLGNCVPDHRRPSVCRRSGLTVPPANPEELSRAICRLIGDRPWRDRLAAAGRELVVERFSQERQVERTQALYLDALARSRRAARRFIGSTSFEGA